MKNYLLPLLGLISLASCVYPVQYFEPGSSLDLVANPSFKLAGNRHQVLVAVIDSGVDYTHPGLAEHIRLNSNGQGVGLDLLGRDGYPYPILLDPKTGDILEDFFSQNDHGTHVASLATLGGHLNTQDGRRLDAGKLIGLVPVRALPVDDEGLSPDVSEAEIQMHVAGKMVGHLLKALDFVSSEGAKVANLSLGVDARELKDLGARKGFVDRMKTELYPKMSHELSQILFVFAAGNEKMEITDDYFPGSFKGKNMLTVGALNKKGEIAEYSNHGPLVDIYVVGSEVKGMIPGGKRERMSGTSMAAPLISNLAAKVLLVAPCLSASEVKTLIISEANRMVLKVEESEESQTVKVADFQKTLLKAKSVKCY